MMENNYGNEPRRAATPTQKHLEEQFGQMRSSEPVPEQLKEEVFNSLDTILLVADVVDLFTVKFTQTESEFLDLFQEESAKQNTKK